MGNEEIKKGIVEDEISRGKKGLQERKQKKAIVLAVVLLVIIAAVILLGQKRDVPIAQSQDVLEYQKQQEKMEKERIAQYDKIADARPEVFPKESADESSLSEIDKLLEEVKRDAEATNKGIAKNAYEKEVNTGLRESENGNLTSENKSSDLFEALRTKENSEGAGGGPGEGRALSPWPGPQRNGDNWEGNDRSMVVYSRSAAIERNDQGRESGRGESGKEDFMQLYKDLAEKYAGGMKGFNSAFEGKSERSGGSRSSGEKNNPTVIYNELPPVRIIEGDFLEGVLQNRVVCDTEESPVLVSIYKNFYDADNQWIIVPTGTRVIGKSQVVDYQGASRLYVWFERMVLPNGQSIEFSGGSSMKGLDRTGAFGLKTSINRHFFQKFGSSLLFGVLDGLGGLAQNKARYDSIYSNLLDRTSYNFLEINREIFRQYANIVPTITVKAGHQIKVYMSADVVISPYARIDERLRGGR